ncbi:uncharacterized protein LOC129600896 isoform X2 [Paramacrobiotus metropolitanus]|uniref:uncharacterized protein LOC129600896 isoform X2 n=1 Tax=Paramacrobiotus metropolitanus TaxID=2943436 RepID=UPI00244659D2|nr:uncharacterized protein LOC129600896 isoform X2 [Paramacrobiotus metropolitanus]
MNSTSRAMKNNDNVSESAPRVSHYRTKGPKVYSRFKARRTEYADISVLQTLSEEQWNAGRFGRQRLEQLLENSLYSVTVIEQTKRFEHICGYAAFSDIPTRVLSHIPNWSDILQSSLPTKYFSNGNTIFLSAFLSEPSSYPKILEESLTVLFHLQPELDYCLVVTEGSELDCVYQKWFPAWITYTDGTAEFCVGICRKEYVFPRMEIREAGYDDVPHVIGWFGRLHEKVRREVGEIWLEKIVRASPQSKDTKCFVVKDTQDTIRGFIGLTTANIDWDYLNHYYETDIFHRFKKITDFDRVAARYSNCDIDLGGTTSDDPIYGLRQSAPSFAEGGAPVLPEQESTEMFITALVNQLDTEAIENEEQRRGTIETAKEIVAELVDAANAPDRRSTAAVTLDAVEEIETAAKIMIRESRTNVENAKAIVEDIVDSSRDQAEEPRTTVEAAALLLDSVINEIDLPDDDTGPYGLLESPAKVIASASSTFDLLSTARAIVNDMLETIDHPRETLTALKSSLLAVPKVVIPVIGPSASDIDLADYREDSVDYSPSFNIDDYAKRLVGSLVKVAESSHSLTPALTDSVKSLINFLEEQGVKMAELRDHVNSVMDVAGIDEATVRSVENLIADLERLGSDIVEEVTEPPLSKNTLTTLQILIQKLEEQAQAELAAEEKEFDLRLRPRRFKLSQVPYEFSVEAENLPFGTFAIQSTNIEDLVRPARLSIGTEAADRLAALTGGIRDIVTGMNFNVKKPTVPVYDSEHNVIPPTIHREKENAPVRKKPDQPRILDTADELLERALKNQHGIKDYASEPMFSSADDLVRVPQPHIASNRQEPGVRHLQRRYNQFYRNPVVGRSHEFNYIEAHGGQNAMFLFLFYLDPLYTTHTDDILMHCYRTFPGYDYLLTLTTTTEPDGPLHQLLRVPFRENRFLREDLYIHHIAGLIRAHDIEFFPGSTRDLEAIQAFLGGKADGDLLFNAFRDAVYYRTNLETSRLLTTVFRVDGCIIGFAVYFLETDMEYLVAHYALEDLMFVPVHSDTGFCRILHFIINPLFNHFNRYILKELMRSSGATCFFYKFYPVKSQAERKDTRPCCLEEMLLVRPRNVLRFSDKADWKLLPPQSAREQQEPFALYMVNRRWLFDRKKVIPSRIAVIGASDMSLQVTRNIILNPHLRFANLILVSSHGIPLIDQDDVTVKAFPSARQLFTRRELNQLAIPANIQVIFGTAITLDKSRKVLYVNDKQRIPVDYLVIGTGLQFLDFDVSVDSQWLTKLAETVCAEACAVAKMPPRRFQSPCQTLTNFFVVNDAWQADSVISQLEAIRKDSQSGYYVIYGMALESYGCVTTLLRMGILAEEIVFVDPAPDIREARTAFSSPECETWVKNLMYINGIVVCSGWHVVAYNDGDGGETIKTVTFWTDERTFKTYNARAFFNFTEKDIGPSAYTFVNSSYLVMDGKLVVDERFHATEQWIWAGGAGCKFPRRLYAPDFRLAEVNAREIGDIIAMDLIKTIAPSQLGGATGKDADRVPEFKKPVVECTELPFGWYYCNIN